MISTNFKSFGMPSGGMLTCVLAAFVLLSCGPSASETDNPPNGNLDETFISEAEEDTGIGTETNLENQTAEEAEQEALTRLKAEGWEEEEMDNGPMPRCYNFLPAKSDIDNYLEVEVGGGTDVAIKVMDKNTEKCVRFVFINRNSTYLIKNLPEGVYYLKIAYGKDWLSRVIDGSCTGKFLRNPIYELGEDNMDFRLVRTSDGYSVPSFQVRLDVISTDAMNNFETTNISEADFNK